MIRHVVHINVFSTIEFCLLLFSFNFSYLKHFFFWIYHNNVWWTIAPIPIYTARRHLMATVDNLIEIQYWPDMHPVLFFSFSFNRSDNNNESKLRKTHINENNNSHKKLTTKNINQLHPQQWQQKECKNGTENDINRSTFKSDKNELIEALSRIHILINFGWIEIRNKHFCRSKLKTYIDSSLTHPTKYYFF